MPKSVIAQANEEIKEDAQMVPAPQGEQQGALPADPKIQAVHQAKVEEELEQAAILDKETAQAAARVAFLSAEREKGESDFSLEVQELLQRFQDDSTGRLDLFLSSLKECINKLKVHPLSSELKKDLLDAAIICSNALNNPRAVEESISIIRLRQTIAQEAQVLAFKRGNQEGTQAWLETEAESLTMLGDMLRRVYRDKIKPEAREQIESAYREGLSILAKSQTQTARSLYLEAEAYENILWTMKIAANVDDLKLEIGIKLDDLAEKTRSFSDTPQNTPLDQSRASITQAKFYVLQKSLERYLEEKIDAQALDQTILDATEQAVKALEAAKKAKTPYPSSWEAKVRHQYSMALRSKGKLEEGLAQLDKVLSLQPYLRAAIVDKIFTLSKLKKPTEAIKLADRWIALGVNDLPTEQLLSKIIRESLESAKTQKDKYRILLKQEPVIRRIISKLTDQTNREELVKGLDELCAHAALRNSFVASEEKEEAVHALFKELHCYRNADQPIPLNHTRTLFNLAQATLRELEANKDLFQKRFFPSNKEALKDTNVFCILSLAFSIHQFLVYANSYEDRALQEPLDRLLKNIMLLWETHPLAAKVSLPVLLGVAYPVAKVLPDCTRELEAGRATLLLNNFSPKDDPTPEEILANMANPRGREQIKERMGYINWERWVGPCFNASAQKKFHTAIQEFDAWFNEENAKPFFFELTQIFLGRARYQPAGAPNHCPTSAHEAYAALYKLSLYNNAPAGIQSLMACFRKVEAELTGVGFRTNQSLEVYASAQLYRTELNRYNNLYQAGRGGVSLEAGQARGHDVNAHREVTRSALDAAVNHYGLHKKPPANAASAAAAAEAAPPAPR